MFENQNAEQAVRFNLQYFAEGDGIASPPAEPVAPVSDPASQSVEPTVSEGNKGPVSWEQHQAAIKGMNEAQRKAAAWEKLQQQYGVDPDTAAQQIALAKQLEGITPQDVLSGLVQQYGPQEAARMFASVMGGSQPQQAGPFADDEWAQNIFNETKKEIDPIKREFEQIKQYQAQALMSQVQGFANEYASAHPELGLTGQQIFEAAQRNSQFVPPTKEGMDKAGMLAVGGYDALKAKIAASQQQEMQRKIAESNQVSSTITGNGVIPMVQADPSKMSQRQLRDAAANQVRQLWNK